MIRIRRAPSPAMIRRAAWAAFSARMRAGGQVNDPPRPRRAEPEETPLSAAEIRHGIVRGLIAADDYTARYL